MNSKHLDDKDQLTVAEANARTLTLIVPGTKPADVKRSLETIISDLDLKYEDKGELRKPN